MARTNDPVQNFLRLERNEERREKNGDDSYTNSKNPKATNRSGRPADIVVEIRQQYIQEIIDKNPDATYEQIREKLKEKINLNPHPGLKLPSRATLYNDLNALEWNHSPKIKTKRLYRSEFSEFSVYHGASIRQVRLSVGTKNFIFFPLTEINNSCTISSAYFEKGLSDLKEQLANEPHIQYSLVHLYIILHNYGYEELLCRFFKAAHSEILYTSTHHYCAEIVFEYNDLDDIYPSIFNLLPEEFELRENDELDNHVPEDNTTSEA